LHVEEVSGESILINESICHYYVEVVLLNVKYLTKVFPWGCSDPSTSPTKAKFANLIVVTLKLSL
jgi:hypothetical protein